MKKMYVLIGEQPGDYDDFYQRYREVLAVSESKKELDRYAEQLVSDDYVEFVVEEVTFVP